ncbi:MAG: DUF4224 domain-containing protein [Alphaproteobacteria bacterium]|nr:DUF4224 domain-containing protein [Alphaproteobacteria bacterium]
MFLNQDQIAALTGKQQPSAQRRALNLMGITHKLRPDGTLVVLEQHVCQELGGAVAPTKIQTPKVAEPNWSAI